MEKKKACVTGGNGFMASILIKQLLDKGYVVHATVRNPYNDPKKVSYLKKLEAEGGNIKLFNADLDEEGSFDEAVNGCDYVFHVATPVNVMTDDPENELIKPAIHGVLNVMNSCLKASGTVKRIILTSSAAAVSANNLNGTGYVLDEESWSDIDFLYKEKPPTWGYMVSKLLAEKEAWKFAQENKLDLVRIIPALTVGPTSTDDLPFSIRLPLGLFTGDNMAIEGLRVMQQVSGSVSFGHVEDVCRAHVFLAETESASGRYICTAVNTSLPELAVFLSKRYPPNHIPTEFGDLPKKAKLSLSSQKLNKAGFEFKYNSLEAIFDEMVEYFKSKGLIPK